MNHYQALFYAADVLLASYPVPSVLPDGQVVDLGDSGEVTILSSRVNLSGSAPAIVYLVEQSDAPAEAPAPADEDPAKEPDAGGKPEGGKTEGGKTEAAENAPVDEEKLAELMELTVAELHVLAEKQKIEIPSDKRRKADVAEHILRASAPVAAIDPKKGDGDSEGDATAAGSGEEE